MEKVFGEEERNEISKELARVLIIDFTKERTLAYERAQVAASFDDKWTEIQANSEINVEQFQLKVNSLV